MELNATFHIDKIFSILNNSMDFNGDFKFDLLVGQVAEAQLHDVLSNKKIEVKNDLKATRTGNVFIEYESRGKRSGISTTHSEWYCINIGSCMILLETSKLKELCRKYIRSDRDIVGGDSNTSRGVLLPLSDLIKENNG